VCEGARAWLGGRVIHWGTATDRAHYEALLETADIAISTAKHEFFGISMLEATHWGAFPLVPQRLSYPEIFPSAYHYDSDPALHTRLTELCRAYTQGTLLRADRREITMRYATQHVLPRFQHVFERLSQAPR